MKKIRIFVKRDKEAHLSKVLNLSESEYDEIIDIIKGAIGGKSESFFLTHASGDTTFFPKAYLETATITIQNVK